MPERLEQLAQKYGADKLDLGFIKHYQTRFDPIRHDVKKVLEIGVETGKSHRMWIEYFPNATVYGIDIFNEQDRSGYVHEFNKLQQDFSFIDRSKIFKGDQENVNSLNDFILMYGGNFDIIIDDGGHTMKQQQISLKVLFNYVKSGGYYVIEDLHSCSGQWKTLYGYDVILPGDTLTTDLLYDFEHRLGKIHETNYIPYNELNLIKGMILSCKTEIGRSNYVNLKGTKFNWPTLISFIQRR